MALATPFDCPKSVRIAVAPWLPTLSPVSNFASRLCFERLRGEATLDEILVPNVPVSLILLVAGIPASGKTTYASWLKGRKGFVHLDVDETGGIHLPSIFKMGPRVVVDWGFPPEELPHVMWLRDQGVQIWWFDGDRVAAKESFFRRPQSPPARYFERQMEGIHKNWKKIEAVFAGRIIETVTSGGGYLTPEEIFDRMFGSPSSS